MIEYVFLRTLVMYYHSIDANFRHLVNDRLLNLMCKVVELCFLSGRDLVFLSETGSLALVVFYLKHGRPYGRNLQKESMEVIGEVDVKTAKQPNTLQWAFEWSLEKKKWCSSMLAVGVLMGWKKKLCVPLCVWTFKFLLLQSLRWVRNPINQGPQLPKSRVSALTTAHPVLRRMGLLVF